MQVRTRTSWAFALGATAVAAVLLSISTKSNASDHEDTPYTKANPRVDIADFYAFMRPEGTAPTFQASDHLVLAMTLNPNATGNTKFDPNVAYKFTIGVGGSPLDSSPGQVRAPLGEVLCKFQPPDPEAGNEQPFVCSARGQFASGTTNVVSGSDSDPIRAYAGLRSDPAFGDVAALDQTVASGELKFATQGVNSFDKKNVLALVVDVDVSKTFARLPRPMRPTLAVFASVGVDQ
jgi:hypothetical protein